MHTLRTLRAWLCCAALAMAPTSTDATATASPHLVHTSTSGFGFPDCTFGVDGRTETCAQRPATDDNQTLVACVGDSITAGYRASSGAHTYPSVLASLLGEAYKVTNLGEGGATMQVPPTPPHLTPPRRRHQLDPHSPLCRYPPHTPPSSHTPPPHSTSTPHPLSTHSPQTWADAPYWIRPGFRALTAAKWDVIILMLGTNDAKQHGQKCPLGCDPARLLRLLGTRLAALRSSALPGRGRLTGRPANASGARASRLQDP